MKFYFIFDLFLEPPLSNNCSFFAFAALLVRPHMVARYCWHLLLLLPFWCNKSGFALTVFLVIDSFLAMDASLGLRLCLYSTVTCSRTSTWNMLSFNLGFTWSLTNAKANWSLGLKPSNSLNIRHENRLLLSPCFLRISALSGTSANYIHSLVIIFMNVPNINQKVQPFPKFVTL